MTALIDRLTDGIIDGITALTPADGLLLAVALTLALGFEFVNGFHDAANAVATVIYTQSLSPVVAVIWSGLWNLIGVLVSTGAVAFSLVSLLPADRVLAIESGAGLIMVFAVLIAAILWNLGTWYLGLPVSSSHTLVGAILGVGLASSLLQGAWGEGVNRLKAQEVGLSLLISPLIGFGGAGLLLLLLKGLPQPDSQPDSQPDFSQPDFSQPNLPAPANSSSPPPFWTRILLILTCTGVSFAHGSNDGQKGMGLILLILVGLLPGYALNLNLSAADLAQIALGAQQINQQISLDSLDSLIQPQPMTSQQGLNQLAQFLKPTDKPIEPMLPDTRFALALTQQDIVQKLAGKTALTQLAVAERAELRRELYLVSESLAKLERLNQLPLGLEPKQTKAYCHSLKAATQFIPVWVKAAVAVALGLGTMIGWRRIVVTVGEKIGKEPLTYRQGAAAELVAIGTILAADSVGLPVSTTQVLSAGVAGTMVANGSGLQSHTIRRIVLAWVLTLPACMLLSGVLFMAGLAAVEKLEPGQL